MFARRLRIEIKEDAGVRLCPLEWLDRFFMRHFTGLSALEDTLPTAEGRLEAGFNVDLDFLHQNFEDWLRGHKMLGPGAQLRIIAES